MTQQPNQQTPQKTATEKHFSEMGVMEHLNELRSCLINSLIAVCVAGFACYYYCDPIFIWLMAPFKVAFPNESLVGTTPAEALVLKITVSFFAGALASLPVIFYQFWKFISPGMHDNERRLVLPFVTITTICFALGVMFCYDEVLPYSFAFFNEEYTSIGLEPQITLSSHITLTMQMLVAFGLVFELPVLSFCLARLGIITTSMLTSGFRYIIVAIFIIAAVMSPPDVISQMLLAVPMLVLYVLSIFVVKIAERKKV